MSLQSLNSTTDTESSSSTREVNLSSCSISTFDAADEVVVSNDSPDHYNLRTDHSVSSNSIISNSLENEDQSLSNTKSMDHSNHSSINRIIFSK